MLLELGGHWKDLGDLERALSYVDLALISARGTSLKNLAAILSEKKDILMLLYGWGVG